MLCKNCGKEITEENKPLSDNNEKNGERSWFITLILSWFMGIFGFHRFYTGYTGIGIAQALTLGGLGIWTLVDLIFICIGKYKTKEGRALTGYTKTFGIASIFIYILLCASKFAINQIANLFVP